MVSSDLVASWGFVVCKVDMVVGAVLCRLQGDLGQVGPLVFRSWKTDARFREVTWGSSRTSRMRRRFRLGCRPWSSTKWEAHELSTGAAYLIS